MILTLIKSHITLSKSVILTFGFDMGTFEFYTHTFGILYSHIFLGVHTCVPDIHILETIGNLIFTFSDGIFTL